MLIEQRLTIYSAPAIQEASPPQESTIRAMLCQSERDPVLHFTLGNLLFRDGKYRPALGSYQQALRLQLGNAPVMANIALCYFRIDELREALVWAERALAVDATLEMSGLLSALINYQLAKFERAEEQIAELLKHNPNVTEAYELLAILARERGDTERSYRLSRQAFQRDDTRAHLRDELCLAKFQRGKKLFREGKRIAAYAEWMEAHYHYGASFAECRDIVVEMRELRKSFAKARTLDMRIVSIREDIVRGRLQEEQYYDLFLDFFFSVGLIPEVFEYRHLLDERAEYWQQLETKDGKQPYSRFRLLVIDCYRGALDRAKDALLICMDVLPEKKHHSLRLGDVYSFVSEFTDALRGKAPEPVKVAVEDWKQAGFTSEFEIEVWKKTGLVPEAAADWSKAGIRGQDALEWRRHKIELSDAVHWSACGFSDPDTVKRWLRGGIAPEQAALWQRVFVQGVDEAVVWLKQGFLDPFEVNRWLALLPFPWDAKQWTENGFAIDEAELWFAESVRDPYEAKRIKESLDDDSEVADSDG